MKYIAITLAGLLLSCSKSQDYENLAETYFESFISRDWKAIYSCKTPEFKQTVPYKVFVKSMEDSFSEFGVGEVQFYKVEREGDFIRVPFEFTILDSRSGVPILTMNDAQTWLNVSENTLFCLDLGMSSFFPLNFDVAQFQRVEVK
ncbi:hypothetical protein [Gilvimarinus chinensis]|uniref:hypothetical protein n=1 Tax=Gilvimarinus chinensis TaxID=396005 RepID=UPI0003601286|nr:hypothetical protein [Gilvimarinus chinensis]